MEGGGREYGGGKGGCEGADGKTGGGCAEGIS